MSDPFIGEVRGWACTYPPRGWALCNGQQVPISQAQALFAIISNLYGPYTQQTFTLPDLRGLSPMDAGNPVPAWVATGMPTTVAVAQKLGTSSVTLNYNQMANHTHQAVGATAPPASMTVTPSSNAYVSRPLMPPSSSFPTGVSYSAWTNSGAPNVTMAPQAIGTIGGSQAHENRQPFLTFNFCVALEGVYPSRN
ncbi:MAG: tail fiber protein [Pseudomonadota bacterium]|jgi:microcystin-dependent protein